MDKREMIERALGSLADANIDYEQAWQSMAILATFNQIGGEGHIFTKEDIVSLVKLGRDKTLDALAQQAIVIECDLKHIISPFRGLPATRIGVVTEDISCPQDTYIPGHHGTPGKALCIILSLEE